MECSVRSFACNPSKGCKLKRLFTNWLHNDSVHLYTSQRSARVLPDTYCCFQIIYKLPSLASIIQSILHLNHTTFSLRTIHFLFVLKIVQLMRLILLGSLRFTRFSHFLLFSLKNFYFSIDQHFVTVDNAFKITTSQ